MHRSGDPGPANPAEAAAVARLDDAARLCGWVGHDFDNILTGIMGFAELAQAKLAPDSQAAAYLAELLRVAGDALAITTQLHSFHRSNEPNAKPTCVAAVCSADRFAGLPTAVRLEIGLPADLPAVAVGAAPLQTIFDHLIRNAAEAMPAGGVIAVSARTVSPTDGISAALPGPIPAGEYVELAVADTGPGFHPAVAARAGREPFVTTKPRRRGLGLPTVLRTLAAHGGGLRIESSSRGTTVVVYLPVATLFSSAPARIAAGPTPLEVAPL